MKLYLVIPVLLIICSCEEKQTDCFISTGDNDKQEILTDEFKAIRVSDIFNLVLVQDTVHKVVMEGGENLLPHVKAGVRNDTLVLESSLRCIWLRDYEKITLTVHFKELEHIVTLAPVNVISYDTIRCDNLEYYAIGEIGEADIILSCAFFRFDDSYTTLGLFKFRGKTGKSRFYVNYGSSVDAAELVSLESDIYQKTTGDIYVNVTEHLRIWIWGPGNVFYSGDPELVEIMEEWSSGKIIGVD
jgi:hypothetical protein